MFEPISTAAQSTDAIIANHADEAGRRSSADNATFTSASPTFHERRGSKRRIWATMAVSGTARAREAAGTKRESARPTSARLGLSVPHEWWPSAPLLKSYEAAGFGWVQLHSPPVSVLSDPRQCTAHGVAAATALATTSLQAVVHAPAGLRAGTRTADVAFEGMLSYAAEVGASQVVYHALACRRATARAPSWPPRRARSPRTRPPPSASA